MIRSNKPGWCERVAALTKAGTPAPLKLVRSNAAGRDPDASAVRSEGEGAAIMGYAAVFDSVTTLYEWRYGSTVEIFREVVRPGAFARAIREGQDVCGVIEHDWDEIIARTTGGTLVLSEDATGLAAVARPPNTTRANDLRMDIEAANIQGMSFRFYPQKTNETVQVSVRNVAGQQVQFREVLRELIDVDISDVSWVAWPAYPATSTSVRASGAGNAGGVVRSQDDPEAIWARADRMDPASPQLRARFGPGGDLEWGRVALLKHQALGVRGRALLDAHR